MQELPSILGALRLLGLDATEARARTPLGPREAAWLSGYFAAIARGVDGRPISLDEVFATLSARETGSKPAQPVRVLYGTETGNAKGLADTLVARLRGAGAQAEAVDLAAYKARALAREQTVVIVTSTHGDGTPPETASRFFEQLLGAGAPESLASLRYAVLGLGDSSYEHFCRAARVVDERLAELGAVRLVPRQDCDLDYQTASSRWIDALLTKLGEDVAPGGDAPGVVEHARSAASGAAAASGTAARYDRESPFLAPVLENFALTGRGSTKETRHLTLSLAGSGLRYAPGDALGVMAPNAPALVQSLLEALRLTGDEEVTVDDASLPLARALTERLDITVVTPRFLEAWGAITGDAALRSVLSAAPPEARRRFLREHHVLDVVRAHPARAVDPSALVAGLRRLTPRLYSLASSLAASPDEAHLTVSVVRYQLRERPCTGVASGYMAERTAEQAQLSVYVQENPRFRLPADPDARVVMIGAGTGIAPYRAFMQERAATGARSGAWLFFGERNFRTDFLYQVEWQAWLRDQTLTRMSVAFSRDGAAKVYVQDRLREHARELYDWLENGAHLYVCGDAEALAPAVHEALLAIVASQRGSRERASAYLAELAESRRYQRDVY